MGKNWNIQSRCGRCCSKLLLVYLSVVVLLVVLGIRNGNNRRMVRRAQAPPATPSDDFAEDVADLSPREIPRGSLANKTKYSRLGNQVQLDYANMCPNGSLMLDESQRSSFVPEHQDCPTLFIVGARKGGSTSLYTYVSEHPLFKGVFLHKGPQAGETFYFSSHRWKTWNVNRYMQLFKYTTDHMTGESSVAYLVNCHLPERLWKSCGKKAKIVILLRNPINRFESNFLMRIGRKYASQTTLSTIVTRESAKFHSVSLKKGAHLQSIEHSWEKFRCHFFPADNMIFEGLYYVHIMNWLCNFPPENILILNSEEFFSDTQAVFEEVIEFLGLPPLDSNTTASITSKAYNTRTQRPRLQQKMSETDRKKLKAVYETSNKPLLRLLSWEDLDWN